MENDQLQSMLCVQHQIFSLEQCKEMVLAVLDGLPIECRSVQELMFRANVKCQAANKLDAYMRRPRSSLLVSPAVSPGEKRPACRMSLPFSSTESSQRLTCMLDQCSGGFHYSVVTLYGSCKGRPCL